MARSHRAPAMDKSSIESLNTSKQRNTSDMKIHFEFIKPSNERYTKTVEAINAWEGHLAQTTTTRTISPNPDGASYSSVSWDKSMPAFLRNAKHEEVVKDNRYFILLRGTSSIKTNSHLFSREVDATTSSPTRGGAVSRIHSVFGAWIEVSPKVASTFKGELNFYPA